MTTIASNTTAKPELAALPESLTIGGNTYKVSETPELKQFVGQVAQVEKSKLYSTIEELKAGIAELQKIPVQTVTQQAAPAATDLTVFKGEILAAVRQIVQQEVQPLQNIVQQQQAESVADYRTRLIAANEANCIPEMVKGSTKEELDASLLESIQIRAKFAPVDFNKPGGTQERHQNVPAEVQAAASTAEAKMQAVAPVTVAAPQAQPAVVLAPAAISAVEDSQEDIGNMSHEDFGKRRGELEAKMKSLVGS